MNEFFQALANLSGDQDNWTAAGIDGEMAGKKAVFSGGTPVFASEGILEELQKLLDTGESGSGAAGQGQCISGSIQNQCFLSPDQKPGLITTAGGRIFLERIGSVKKIVLCGGGHVSLAVLAVARLLEFEITVIEDRPGFAREAKKAGADSVICENFVKALEELETGRDTYIIIMTRGHRHDLDCLRVLFRKEYAYLGMMGSKGRVKGIRKLMLEEGFPSRRVEELHAPVGLSIGAVTTAEIAVSVMAEVIEAKSLEKRDAGYEKEVKSWLFGEEDRKPAVLATIVARKGSAPRQTGTKMLVFADGTILGTIGGGCMEAETAGIARHMLSAQKERFRTCFVDMTGRDAEEEGMVCGGTLEIFLEIL